MRRSRSRPEVHRSQRSNWLRAVVLGANDGILSTASLVLGGAPRRAATIRVIAWGALAMAVTAGIGALVGTVA